MEGCGVRFDNERLISIIQTHPALWDRNDPDYADRIKKENAWRAVLEAVYGEEEMEKWDVDKKNQLGKDVQKRWKNLRNCFAREVGRRKRTRSGSGKSWKTYIYFDQMSFLLPSMTNTHSESSQGFMEEDETEESEEASELIVPCETVLLESQANPGTTKKRKFDFEADGPRIVSTQTGTGEEPAERNSVQWKQEKKSLEYDPDKLFLLSLLRDLKNVPDSNKASVKIALIKAIHDGQYNDTHPPRQTIYNTPQNIYNTPAPSAYYMLPNSTFLSNLQSNFSAPFQEAPSHTQIIIGQPSAKQSPFSTVSTQTSAPLSQFRSSAKFKPPPSSRITSSSVTKSAIYSDSEDSTDPSECGQLF